VTSKLHSFLFLGVLTLVVQAADSEKPRAARSVHLGYSAVEGTLFYNEMVVEKSVNGSYFMACGWNTGYFGIQQLSSATNKLVLFSVWDSARGDDPTAVKTEERVEVLFQGEGVRIKRFGGEGTGGQCMAPFQWEIGETNRFLIRAEIQAEKTAYTAWLHKRGESSWWKLATFRTKTKGRPLSGYYSFVEDFRRDDVSATEQRRALFQNGWVKSLDGKWIALEKARFTASSATWEAKETINAGTIKQAFFLETGGDTRMTTQLKSLLDVTVSKIPPSDLPLE
jgi:hypothetical protein